MAATLSVSERSPTGVPGLDEVMYGGLVTGRFYLVEGNPGSGKTTLGLQFVLEGRRLGERCLVVTLAETADEIEAGARSHGWSLEGIEILELSTDAQRLAQDEQLTMYHPAEVELGEAVRALLERIEQVRPQRVVIDSLSELRLLAQGSLRFRRQVLALKHFFSGRGCTVLLLDDSQVEPAELQLQSVAHGVITLDRHAPTYGQTRRTLEVTKLRGSDFASGVHDLCIAREGVTVFPRLTRRHHGGYTEMETVCSGVVALDLLLGGGIERGTTTLLIGPPGTGKSTLALQYAVAAAQRDEHAAVFTFEESTPALRRRAAGVGLPLREGGGAGEVSVMPIDPAEISPGEFGQRVRDAVERDAARVVVIDSLNGYINALPEDRYLTAQLHELLAFLDSHGVTTFLVAAQSGAIGYDLRAPVDASYLADTVVMLRLYEHAGCIGKAVSVLKKRSGRHEATIRPMWFGPDGVHLGEPLVRLRGVLSGVPTEVPPSDGAGHAG